MSGIRGKNTKPELIVRRLLHAQGFRFRLHRKDLPGKPDIVLPKYHAVILVHGCFWHKHECRLFRMPATRTEWWNEKLSGNRERDRKDIASLLDSGWRVLVVWECAMPGKGGLPLERIAEKLRVWLLSPIRISEIEGE